MACGPDGIPSHLIKELKHEVVLPLTILVNRCLEEGYFPECLKIGKVRPVFKRGARNKLKNYRPITITSVIGKIIECIVNEQLTCATDHLLPSTMFGFRKNTGTDEALTRLMDDIKERRTKGEFAAIISCDASAAFDILNRDLVIAMLKRLGAGTSVTTFISNFMDNAKQFVVINEDKSEEWCFDVGTGQGHVLSPPLYNIGTISQYYWTKLSTLYGYADDGSDVISAPTINECNQKIQEVFAARKKWYDLSGMALNIEKTMVMGFGFRPNTLDIHDTKIEPVTSLKFLGMEIQDNFNLDNHVKQVSTKIRQAAANIRTDGRHLCISDKRRLYMGWIQGTICSNGTAYLPLLTQGQAESLQTSANAGIRSVANLPRRSSHISISSIRKILNILSIAEITEKLILTHAWKTREKIAPQNQSGPTTRSRSQGNVPQPNQQGIRSKMISTFATCAFNRLPLEVKIEKDSKKAKRLIKNMFSR